MSYRLRRQERMGLEKSGVLVSGLLLLMLIALVQFSASILKVIARASNLPPSLGSRSVESVYFCFPTAPQDN